MLATGDKLPDAAAPDDAGNPVSLKTLVGTPFVLWFYPKADTPG